MGGKGGNTVDLLCSHFFSYGQKVPDSREEIDLSKILCWETTITSGMNI